MGEGSGPLELVELKSFKVVISKKFEEFSFVRNIMTTSTLNEISVCTENSGLWFVNVSHNESYEIHSN